MAIFKKKDAEPSAAPKKKTAKKQRKSVATFFKEVLAELKKVNWPTRKELVSYSVVVAVFIVLMSAVLFVMDTAFGYLLDLILSI